MGGGAAAGVCRRVPEPGAEPLRQICRSKTADRNLAFNLQIWVAVPLLVYAGEYLSQALWPYLRSTKILQVDLEEGTEKVRLLVVRPAQQACVTTPKMSMRWYSGWCGVLWFEL